MAREVIGSVWDRTNRNNVNNNFEELYNDLGTATGTKDKLDNFLDGTGVISSKMLEYGAVHGNYIRDGGIGTRHLLDDTVTTAKIQDDAVTTAKIPDGAVTTAKIPDNNIINRHIANKSISGLKIADGAVTTTKIPDNNIIDRHIANKTISGLKIANGTLPTLALEPQSVTQTRMANRSVGTDQIQFRAMDNIHFDDFILSAKKISDDSLNFNRGRDYPLKNIGTEEHIKFRDAILDVKVYNAQKGKEYRIYRIMKNSDSYVDEGTQSAIEIQSRDVGGEWKNLITRGEQGYLSNYQQGVQTHLIHSEGVAEEFLITLDWYVLDVGDTFNGNTRDYMIDPSLYFYSNDKIYQEGYYNPSENTLSAYVSSSSGAIVTGNDLWTASEFINVLPDTTYFKNRRGAAAFYDKGWNRIEGHTNAISNMIFHTPKNAAFMRTSIPRGKEHGFEVRKLSSDFTSPVSGIFKELLDPFHPSHIKMIGDSNVMGSGGTGYSRSDETNTKLPGSNGTYFNEKGHCWANSLRDHLIEKFNKEQMIGMNHENVKSVKGIVHTVADDTSATMFKTTLYDQSMIEFDFTGSELTLLTNPSDADAIIRVYVNGEQIRAFAPNDTEVNREVAVTFDDGLRKRVAIQADRGSVYLSGMKMQKVVQAKNWGVSGWRTENIIENIDNLMEGNETIVLCLIGSNDRSAHNGATFESELAQNMRYIYMQLCDKGAKPVILSSAPASIENETTFADRIMHKEDVDTAARMAAATFGYEHISVYNHVLDYCLYTGTEIDALLADGVHPNDAGYDVAFNYILKKIGLGRKRPGATW